MKEPRTPIPWTPRTILYLAVAEDIDFAVLAANQHAKLLKALVNLMEYLADPANPKPGLGAKNVFRAARTAIKDVERESES